MALILALGAALATALVEALVLLLLLRRFHLKRWVTVLMVAGGLFVSFLAASSVYLLMCKQAPPRAMESSSAPIAATSRMEQPEEEQQEKQPPSSPAPRDGAAPPHPVEVTPESKIETLNEEGAAAPKPVTLDRYPAIEAPDVVRPSQEFAVQVMLTGENISPQTQVESPLKTPTGALHLQLPPTPERQWPIQVILSATDMQFARGTNTGTMVLPAAGDSSPAVFWLKPVQGASSGRKLLMATLWLGSAYLGRISRYISLTGSGSEGTRMTTAEAGGQSETNAAPATPAARAMAGSRQPGAGNKVLGQSLSLDTRIQPPDLTVVILEHIGAPGMMEVEIQSPFLQPVAVEERSPKGLNEWLAGQYRELASRASRGVITHPGAFAPASGTADDFLRGLGRQLWEQFAPAPFKDAFWKLVDERGDKFTTIQILTDDPTLPCELMRPYRGSTQRNFLGLDFSIARWQISNEPAELPRAPQTDVLNSVLALAPQYAGSLALPGQKAELAALAAVGARRIQPGDIASLRALARAWPSSLVHFAGHGVVRQEGNSDEYAIVLEDGTLDLMTWRGMVPAHSTGHPFFFFNACEVGQAHRTVNFVDGWAPELLSEGASGYIGALWPVGDSTAAQFAEAFYENLRSREEREKFVPIAQVLLAAKREVFSKTHDVLALGYVMYGDPDQKIELVQNSATGGSR